MKREGGKSHETSLRKQTYKLKRSILFNIKWINYSSHGGWTSAFVSQSKTTIHSNLSKQMTGANYITTIISHNSITLTDCAIIFCHTALVYFSAK